MTKNDVENVHRQPAHKLTKKTMTPLTNRCCDDWVIQVGSLNTAVPSKQEKYLMTYLHAWSTAMEHAKKLRNQMQNYLKYMNKTSGTFFLGNVIYDFRAQKFYKVV